MLVKIGNTEIAAIPAILVPDQIDAIVEEQDTNLILGSHPVIKSVRQSYQSLVRKMLEQKPHLPGDIIVKKGHPLHILAIVHDIEKKPTWHSDWLTAALTKIFAAAEQYQVRTMAMPVLGNYRGELSYAAFIELLKQTPDLEKSRFPERIWLLI